MSTISQIAEEIKELYKELVTTSVKFEALEKAIEQSKKDQERFLDRIERDIKELRNKIDKDYEDLHRRLTALEGLMQSTFQQSLKEALVQLGREHLEKHGSLDDFLPERLLGKEEDPGKSS